MSAKFQKQWLESICEETAKEFGITTKELMSKSRQEKIVVPRMAVYWIAKKAKQISFHAIAKFFGKKQHGTVLYGCSTMQNIMDTDKKIQGKVLKAMQSSLEKTLHVP